MSETKTVTRFFTVADYEDEELWLREQHRSGWKMVKMIIPCFYIFERCAPEDVVYRLDYKNNTESDDYMQLVRDFGWEYFARCMGWLYFRKPAWAANADGDSEIFSDNASRVGMVDKIVKTRMLPLVVIFLTCLVPNLLRSIDSGYPLSRFFSGFFSVMFVIYMYLFIHCGRKLRMLKNKYRE